MKERKHPDFKRNEELLKFYLSSFLGGDSYITATNLRKHRLESLEDYKSRLKGAFYLNYCEPVVKVYTQYTCPTSLPRVVVSEEKADQFKKFSDNCTGDGTDLATFIRDIRNNSGVCGYAGVLIDGTHIVENAPAVVTKAYDKSAAPPILRKVLATELIDWSVDSSGQFNWVLIKTQFMSDADPTIDRKIVDRFELWGKDKLRIFVRETDNKEDDLREIDGKEYNLGVVPFCMFINSRSLLDGIPASQIKDIALVNRGIFNYSSLLDSILSDQTFSQLLMPEIEEGEVNERVVGTKRVLTYNALANTSPQFIAPPNGPAEVIIKVIQVLVAEIFRMGVVRKSGAATTDQYSTAFGKAVDFQDTEAALRETADLMESCEYNLSVNVNQWLGASDGSPLWEPKYPKKFDVREMTQALADALQFDALSMGESFMVTLKTQLAEMQFPDMSEELKATIISDIKEATKVEVIENAQLDSLGSADRLNDLGNRKKDKSLQAGQEEGEGSRGSV